MKQDGPAAPEPTGQGVYLESTAPFEVYVGSYGGFSSEDTVIQEVRLAWTMLEGWVRPSTRLMCFPGQLFFGSSLRHATVLIVASIPDSQTHFEHLHPGTH